MVEERGKDREVGRSSVEIHQYMDKQLVGKWRLLFTHDAVFPLRAGSLYIRHWEKEG